MLKSELSRGKSDGTGSDIEHTEEDMKSSHRGEKGIALRKTDSTGVPLRMRAYARKQTLQSVSYKKRRHGSRRAKQRSMTMKTSTTEEGRAIGT